MLKRVKNHVVALVAGVALIIAVAGAAAGVGHTLADSGAATGQAIACSSSSQSGGGC